MDFELNAEFAAWSDRESARIVSLVRDITDEFPKTSGSLHPDLPITKIGREEIIGDLSVSITEPTGKLIARFFPHNGRQLGLSGVAMAEAERGAERIWSR